MNAAAGDVRIRVFTTQKRKYAKLQINRLCLEVTNQQPFRHDWNHGKYKEQSCTEGNTTYVEIHYTIGGGRPLDSGHKDPKSK